MDAVHAERQEASESTSRFEYLPFSQVEIGPATEAAATGVTTVCGTCSGKCLLQTARVCVARTAESC